MAEKADRFSWSIYVHEGFTEKKQKPEEAVRFGGLYIILKKGSSLRGSD